MVDVVVLSGDRPLFEAIRHAVGERNPVWRARTAEESVELLLTGRCGVLLIDMAIVSTRPATLIEQISEQFPDVVVIVAGRRDDESLLARLISDGLVYRYMHKPLSPKRAGMFLNAAIRSHVERREGRTVEPLLPLVSGLQSRVDFRKWLFVAGGLGMFVALLAALLLGERHSQPPPPTSRAAPAPTAPSRPLADPVLSGARAALAAGRYEAPAGRNALDLYSAVLLAKPGHPEASAGLAKTTSRLVELAGDAAQSGDAAEARRLVTRVLAADPRHAAAQALATRLDAPRVPDGPSRPRAIETPATVQVTPPPAPTASAAAAPRVARPVPAPVPARAQVTPDPLTPRYVPATRAAATEPARGNPRIFGPPAASGHPLAGDAQRPSTAEPVPPAASVAAFSSTGAAPALPNADLEQIAMAEPVYPAAALRQRITGWVEVDFTVLESGSVRDVEIVASEPSGVFDASASAAVGAWRFRPRVVNGRPVPQRSSVILRFAVED
jgi:protein TonB